MSTLFDDLKEGLQEAIAFEKGNLKAKTFEAWELGSTHPTGPAYRLLNILAENKEDSLSFIKKC